MSGDSPRTNWHKYALVFLITAAIFATAIYASGLLNSRRVADIESIQQKIAIDLLSLETQFDLLKELSCADITENPILSGELNTLASRLAFAEQELGEGNAEVVRLKQQYSLLEIQDYLLMQKVADKCRVRPVSILYFYSNEGDCADCTRMGHVLTYLRETYPKLRVYSFDYHLDLPALRTLLTVNKVEPRLPTLIVNGKLSYGYKEPEEIEALIPNLVDLKEEAAETATSTQKN